MLHIKEIADRINGDVEGNNNDKIIGVCNLKNGKKNHIAYLSDLKYNHFFETTSASAVLVPRTFELGIKHKTIIRVSNPAKAFIDLISFFYPEQKIHSEIHKSVAIGSNTSIGSDCSIAANTVIGDETKISDGTIISSCVSIGNNVTIGSNSIINSNVSIYNDVQIGDNVIIESGSVIGSDGFGIITDKDKYYKVPHLGTVIINNDVLIGANCCIDRGTLEDTVIGKSTKIDNLIHIAHNVKIGENCLIAAQVGIAGSTEVGNNVMIGGQAGVINHLIIEDDVKIAAKSAVFKSVPSNSYVSGIPSRDHKNRLRQDYLITKLPKLVKRINKLESNSG
tara:strand:- start:881 stop:1891 length:1011 start_codon:yes stop_codon:yes gene_type:complete